jgi:hypothetical protein
LASFDVLLPRLITAHGRGLLVPFLGAGMSVGACPDWADFVKALEGEAGISDPSADDEASLKSPALIRRVNAVLRILGREGPGRFADASRRVLYGFGDGRTTPDQTSALADIDWPLVLTTNYDDLFVRAYAERLRRDTQANKRDPVALRVVGRDTPGCLRVLQSLDATTPATLWALHGFLGRVDGDLAGLGVHIDEPERRALEVVAGHEEYRRIAHASVQYRRAFAEVCRRRSLLFLGASLADVYLMDLISEVQELHGFGAHPHYALVRAGDGHDPEFLRSRFNIVACEY